jgi:membrane protein DedA with SNARE-associated domain
MRRTTPSLWMRLKVPRMVGGLRTMVGLASGTSWSRVNFFLPVTMSSASTRRVGLPITWYCEAGLVGTPRIGNTDWAALLRLP